MNPQLQMREQTMLERRFWTMIYFNRGLIAVLLTAMTFGCQDNAAAPQLPMTPSTDALHGYGYGVDYSSRYEPEKPAPIVAALRLEVSPWRSQFMLADHPM